MNKNMLLIISFIFLLSCNSINTNQKIRVYDDNYRLTGYNTAFDIPLIWFTTNTQYYIMLIKK